MSFIRHKTTKGHTYAYEITSYWDKELQRSRQKTEYLGIVDSAGGDPHRKEIIQKLQLDFGDTYLLDRFISNLDFYSVIKSVFGKKFPELIPLMCYRLCMQSAMYNAGSWFEGNVARILWKKANLSSQNISKILKSLGSENIQRKFFTEYLTQAKTSGKHILIDATSLPNSSNAAFNDWGHNDNGMSKQLRMLCVVDQGNGQPLFYRAMPGNILDMSTLQNTLLELKLMKITCKFVLLDAGYFSEDNTNDMYKQKINFLTRMPKSRAIYKSLIKSELSDLENVKYVTTCGKRGIFAKRVSIDLYGHNGYAYIILDPVRKGKELQDLLLGFGQDSSTKQQAELRKNNEQDILIQQQSDIVSCGIVIFVSSMKIDSKDVVSLYYTRMQIEQIFSFSKSDLQLLPLRKHSEETMSGYLFLQFIILIIFIQLRNAIEDKHTVEQALLTTRNVKCKTFGEKILIAEFTKKQKEIYELCGIKVPRNIGL